MKPEQALEKMCHTSVRTWQGTVYTVADSQYPKFNGRKILVTLSFGIAEFTWIT